MSDTIANRLREARLAQFKTATEAAASLGVPYATYAGHENGTRAFDFDAAILYSRRYKVSLDWLLAGRGRGPGGDHVEPKISGETQILAMLGRIEGLSDTDINVARTVIMNALEAKRVGSSPVAFDDQSKPGSPHREVEPSR